MNNFKPANHLEIRKILMEMQHLGGAVIVPNTLYKVFDMLIYKEGGTKNYGLIRSVTYTFCVMCNEYYLFYFKHKGCNTEFFISEERWSKYYISDYARNESLNRLQTYGLISCEEKYVPQKEKVMQVFQIDSEILKAFRRSVQDIYDEEKAKRSPI